MATSLEQSVKKLVIEALEIQADEEAVQLDVPLNEVGLHSVTFVKLVVLLETEYDIEFDTADLKIGRFNTLQDIVEYVRQKADASTLSS